MAILGIDEVGRGPLAGPLVVGAVILPEPWPEWADELKDSKKLSVRKREGLAKIISKEATVGLGWVHAGELDEVGISNALKLATRRAVEQVQTKRVAFSQIVIDGKVNFLSGTVLGKYASTVVKADDLIKEVSAASIVAKVARDHYMYEIAEKFSGYGFEKNVGYGTRQHMGALKAKGICEEHRKSFEPIRSMVGFEMVPKNVVKNTTLIGNKGEDAACRYLIERGHRILARNFKTKRCEIDIVSIEKDALYFTEVKYRSSDLCGGGVAAVTADKIARMELAAKIFLEVHPEWKNLNPLLAVADVGGGFVVEDWILLA